MVDVPRNPPKSDNPYYPIGPLRDPYVGVAVAAYAVAFRIVAEQRSRASIAAAAAAAAAAYMLQGKAVAAAAACGLTAASCRAA